MTSPRLIHCVESILRQADIPLLPQEVLAEIKAANCYKFKAKDPLGVVRNCLSRHSVENTHSCASPHKRFQKFGKHFQILDEFRRSKPSED